jgi:hypothetical protein
MYIYTLPCKELKKILCRTSANSNISKAMWEISHAHTHSEQRQKNNKWEVYNREIEIVKKPGRHSGTEDDNEWKNNVVDKTYSRKNKL